MSELQVPSKATRPVRSDPATQPRRRSELRSAACCIPLASRRNPASRIPHRSGIAILGSATAARPRPSPHPPTSDRSHPHAHRPGPAQATPRGRRAPHHSARYGTRDVSPCFLVSLARASSASSASMLVLPCIIASFVVTRVRCNSCFLRCNSCFVVTRASFVVTRSHVHIITPAPPRTRLYGRFACRRPQRLFDRGMLTAQLFHASKLVIQSLDRL